MDVDADGDTWEGPVGDGADCDDADPSVWPGAEEFCDAVDSDCDGGLVDDAEDLDGDGAPDCIDDDADGDGQLSEDAGGLDCDDLDPLVGFGQDEICDGADSNCDGVLPDEELDGDTDGALPCDGDCDDDEPTVYPGNTELCDGLDNDCDGSIETPDEADFRDWFLDADSDGYGNTWAPHPQNPLCEEPSGYVEDSTDCNDGQPTVNPGQNEVPDNGLDDDCDGTDQRSDGTAAAAPGCACSSSGEGQHPPAGFALIGLFALRRRRA